MLKYNSMKPNHLPSQPIGIFDSGIGGLTVAHAVVKQLPKENIIYFGDTAHLPYGDKSTAAIQAYAIKIAHMLLKQECKLILIACNSASAAAYELVKEYVGSKAIVMNVIDPVIHHIKDHCANKKVGLIGTRQTVNSHIYKKKLDDTKRGISLSSQATNLLASAIEEFGNANSPVINELLKVYLSKPDLKNIESLVLACTHYPIIKEQIKQHCTPNVEIIDPSEIVALAVRNQLDKNTLLNDNGTSMKHFYVSDYTESFADHAKLFFGEAVKLEHYPLWD